MIPETERDAIYKEFEVVLLEDFGKGMTAKIQQEAKIVASAKSDLIDRERVLMQPKPREHYQSKHEESNCVA